MSARLAGPVRVVGAGLLGTSIGLALTARSVDVILDDASPAQLRLAMDYGAGRAARAGDAPQLIVVCVPPDVTSRVIAAELAAFPSATVTDVASVKSQPLAELAAVPDLARYVGGHPLAGRERGGAVSGRADLFSGRPWVITRHGGSADHSARLVEDLVLDLGAVPVAMTVEQHDDAVALVSHLPQLVASLLASRLGDAPAASVSLAGQGLRDTTRIASSAPDLWVQILGANAHPVAGLLKLLRTDLDEVIEALDAPDAAGSRRRIAEAIASGNAGVARIPGKHGEDRRFAQITVLVDDTPGELARLLTEIGAMGVNMEDLRLEHSPGAQVGLAEISVVPDVGPRLVTDLIVRGWRVAEATR